MTNLIKYLIFGAILLIIISCSKSLQVSKSESNNEKVGQAHTVTSSVNELIKPYRDSMTAKMDEVINTTLVHLEVGVPEGLLGNFVTDLTFSRVRNTVKNTPDFCILNNGGLRTSIPKGDITRGKVFELMPFENELVVVEISADKMLDLIEYIRKRSLMDPSRKAGVPVSNFRMTMSDGEVSNIMISNRQFKEGKTYRVVTSDYLSGGGDKMEFFLNPISIEKTGLKLRDIIMEHIITLKSRGIAVNLALDGRIYNAE